MPADTAVEMDSGRESTSSEAVSDNNNESGTKKIDLQPPPFSEVHDGPEYDKSNCTIEMASI